MSYTPWKPEITLDELDSRLENAYRRIAGSIGFSLAQDRMNTTLLKDAASQAMSAGLDTPGPWFLKVGRGALELGDYRPAGGVSLKDISAEILREFYNEGNTAAQLVKAALYADATRHIRQLGIDEALFQPILKAAEESFVPPSKEAFTQEALPLIGQGPSPSALAALAGIASFAALVVFIRAPIPSILVGVLAAGAAYYAARARLRQRVEQLLRRLPRNLYSLLVSGMNANLRRYEEIVNTGLETLHKEVAAPPQ